MPRYILHIILYNITLTSSCQGTFFILYCSLYNITLTSSCQGTFFIVSEDALESPQNVTPCNKQLKVNTVYIFS